MGGKVSDANIFMLLSIIHAKPNMFIQGRDYRKIDDLLSEASLLMKSTTNRAPLGIQPFAFSCSSTRNY